MSIEKPASASLLLFLVLCAVFAGLRAQATDPAEIRIEDGCPVPDEPFVLEYRPLPELVADEPRLDRPLNRQTILFGPTQVKLRVCPPSDRVLEVRDLTVAVGAAPLCRIDRIGGVCAVDFGTDLERWTLDVSATSVDLHSGEIAEHRFAVSTLDAALGEGAFRELAAADRLVPEERAEAQSVPYDEITRIALVSARNRSAVPGLVLDDFEVSVSGVRGEQLVTVTPMRSIVEPRLLFVLIDVADHVLTTKSGVEWRVGYQPFVRELVQSLGKVSARGRKLLVVRYSSSVDTSPVVDLDEDGLAEVESWLVRPPLDTWRSGLADRSAALLQVYDKFLHDFRGQTLGVIISGGRDTGSSAPLVLPEDRVRELNPPWTEEEMSGLLADLDQGRIDLFPHTEQRGFPLSWVYVSSGADLTAKRFGQASALFRRYGGRVYRLANIRDSKEASGHRPADGSLLLDDVFREVFDDLENAYRLRIRIPNPKQKRVDREIRVRASAGSVRTQTFFRPSSSLRENIERYLSSISKERRFRAAYAARGYPLDNRIFRKVEQWLPEEPDLQVRRVLEETKLLMEFKRGQARDTSLRQQAFEKLYSTPAVQVDGRNRELLRTIRELIARIMSDHPEAYGGQERVHRILR